MPSCSQCGTDYQPSKYGPLIKYAGLCRNCRKKKHTEAHVDKDKDAYLQKHRFYHKKHAYNLDTNEFRRLYELQDAKCAICGIEFPPLTQRAKRVVVDHDHITCKVRALLCGQCNSAVGMVRESVEIAEHLLGYLRAHKQANNYADDNHSG